MPIFSLPKLNISELRREYPKTVENLAHLPNREGVA